MEKLIGFAFAMVIGVIIFAVIGLLVAFPVMWLWNYLAVGLFHLPEISYWQAWALYWLCSLLFGGSSSSSSS